MLEKTYFERLRNALEGIEGCQYSSDEYWGYSEAVLNLKDEAHLGDISFDREQESFLREMALEHLKMGEKNVFLDLCSILAYTGNRSVGEKVQTSLTHYMEFKEGCPSPFDVSISLLAEAGVFEPDEEILFYESGTIGVQKKNIGRSGVIILTDRRIIAVGDFAGGIRSKRQKLYYGDLREPYLSTVDFVRLDRAMDFELKKDEIKMRYDTEYVVEKDRTFYGPYFFKFDLPTSVKVKSGIVQVFITLENLTERPDLPKFMRSTGFAKFYEQWRQVELPANYNRIRLETFFGTIVPLVGC